MISRLWSRVDSWLTRRSMAARFAADDLVWAAQVAENAVCEMGSPVEVAVAPGVLVTGPCGCRSLAVPVEDSAPAPVQLTAAFKVSEPVKHTNYAEGLDEVIAAEERVLAELAEATRRGSSWDAALAVFHPNGPATATRTPERPYAGSPGRLRHGLAIEPPGPSQAV